MTSSPSSTRRPKDSGTSTESRSAVMGCGHAAFSSRQVNGPTRARLRQPSMTDSSRRRARRDQPCVPQAHHLWLERGNDCRNIKAVPPMTANAAGVREAELRDTSRLRRR